MRHYAGWITYSCVDFLDKNRDTLYESICDEMRSSQCELIASLFKEGSGVDGSVTDAAMLSPSKRQLQTTLSTQFRDEIGKLIALMGATTPLYIRCIKPNGNQAANDFDSNDVMKQLTYSGVLAALQIRRSGYPTRPTHGDFLGMFWRFLKPIKRSQLRGAVPMRGSLEAVSVIFMCDVRWSCRRAGIWRSYSI